MERYRDLPGNLSSQCRTLRAQAGIAQSGIKKGGVFAVRVELDRWVRSSPTQKDPDLRRRILEKQTNKLGSEFLLIDSEIALTFANLALTKNNKEDRQHLIQVARKAHRSTSRPS